MIYRDTKYFKYQSQRLLVPHTGPHNPRIYDLNKGGLHANAIRIAQEQASCGCGHCEERPSFGLTHTPPSARIKPLQLVRPEIFWAPLAVCKTLYYNHRHLVFSHNIFSFQSPRELAKFLLQLRTW